MGNVFDIGRRDVDGFLSIQGNQTGNNSILLAPTSGNVGIGTTTPRARLDVQGSIAVGNYTYPGNGNSSYIGFVGNDNTFTSGNGMGGVYFKQVDTSGSNAMGFITHNYGVDNGTRMYIDKVGNVGIGTTGPATKLNVSAGDWDGIQLNNTTAGGGVGAFRFTPVGTYEASKKSLIVGTDDAHGLALRTSALARLYIDASGNVGVGTTSPSGKLAVAGIIRTDYTTNNTTSEVNNGFVLGPVTGAAGAYISYGADGSTANALRGLVFSHDDYGAYPFNWGKHTANVALKSDGTNFTSQMVLTNAGNLGIGTTSPGYKLDVVGTINASGQLFASLGNSGHGYYVCWDSGTRQILFAGGCDNMSDIRLKKDIHDVPAAEGLAAIVRLRPVQFRWKDAERDKNEGVRTGLIAQEVEKVLPSLVGTSNDNRTIKLEDAKTEVVPNIKNVNYLGLIMPLVKSVQELNADNDNLRAQLKAANDNDAAAIEELRREIRALKAAR